MSLVPSRDASLSSHAVDGPAIELTRVVRRYGGIAALDGVSLSIPRGALCGLIGPNGAGKTTLLSILATLDEEFDGDARVGGACVRTETARARTMLGLVPDHARLYDDMTVREMLVFFAHASGVPRARRAAVVDEMVAFCGLAPLADRPAAGLSKGNTQRVCVARALLHDPDVLLLDEPASGLDPRARIELKELLKALASRGKTVLVSSHILTELGDFCDHVVVLERGRVKAAGRIDELYGRTRGAGDGEQPRRVVFELAGDVHRGAALMRTIAGVRDVVVDGAMVSCAMVGPRQQQAVVVRTLVAAGVDVVALVPERKNLEALFLSLTHGDAA